MKTRKEFVRICTECIQETRKEIAIANQKSGYLKYHREIKENKHFDKCRSIMVRNKKKFGYSLSDQYKLIKKTRMGKCHEFAEYLSVKIMKRLRAENVDAEVRIVGSKEVDHIYLQINILLKDEKNHSLWEIDAWNPRIIDASTRPNETIKNEESLCYGTSTDLLFSTTTREFKRRKISERYFIAIKEPKEGQPMRDATPEREIIEKHELIYSDKSLEDAYKNKTLDKDGDIHYLQRKSKWQ